ncbi:DUF433 domain-containing protein [Frigoriglobus tundricola]|uniref:DUF433 domain-containing protein n=1 Tax=Frigoriglobus tundricola TaxID=2774151 RepID=A0A6M5YWA1_9BACT|nr:DUF433 domain-containing protein [Frigoriglobus tundricola]QJW97202.1 hypothetical protein FTUN_4767 [Frigoriglobus tundricola]
MTDPLLSRITIDPAVCHGKPRIRGRRYPAEVRLDLLSSGMTGDDTLADYEDLERDDLLAVLAYAARPVRTKRIQPVGRDGLNSDDSLKLLLTRPSGWVSLHASIE